MIQLTLHEDITQELLSLLLKKKEGKLDIRAKLVRDLQTTDDDIALLDDEIGKIKTALKSHPNGKEIENVTSYSTTLTWIKKAEFALDLLHKKSTTTETVERLLKLEPTLNRKQAVASISSIFSTAFNKKDNPFTKDKNDRGENIYGLKKWDVTPPLM